MEISVRGLRKSFPRQGRDPVVVIDHVDIDVCEKEFVTILGPSGCGKTTILKIIAGIEKADKGEIRPVPGASNGRFPIVWQEHRLFPWLTVLRNVTLPLELKKVEKSKAETRARSVLCAMRLMDFEDYYPWQISSGMAERVAIARALVTESKCLLMDEPFASLDFQTKQTLLYQLQVLRKERGLTVLYVTHDLRDAVQLSDRIIVLTDRPTRVRDVIMPVASSLSQSGLEQHLWDLLKVHEKA